jgi:SOS response associated peptidase (SRAP)
MAPIHNCMPVILDDKKVEEWMNTDNADVVGLRAMLRPAPKEWLNAKPASQLVNSLKMTARNCSERNRLGSGPGHKHGGAVTGVPCSMRFRLPTLVKLKMTNRHTRLAY